MKIHPLAQIFPPNESKDFVEDIRKKGVYNPIVTLDGMILDGAQRYTACKKLGIDTPITIQFRGLPPHVVKAGPLEYVVSMNLKRRHLTDHERVKIADKLIPEIEKQLREQIATNGEEGISETPVSKNRGRGRPRGKTIKRRATEKAANVMKVSVRAVHREQRRKKKPKPLTPEQRKAKEYRDTAGLTKSSTLAQLFRKCEGNDGAIFLIIGNYDIRCRRLTCSK